MQNKKKQNTLIAVMVIPDTNQKSYRKFLPSSKQLEHEHALKQTLNYIKRLKVLIT